MFKWFDTSPAEAFARELSAFMVAELRGTRLDSLDNKGRKKAERAMERGARKVQDFRTGHKMNFYKKSKLANAFLWSLKDAGWPESYANQMTDWLTLRL